MKMIKVFFGLILIPLVSSAAFSFYKIAEEFFRDWDKGLWFLSGIVAYILIRLVFSKIGISIMEFAEVFYHETIHAIYSVIFFKGVKSFFVSDKRGGEIETSKSNFIIELSPYFFPLVAIVFSGIKIFIRGKYFAYLVFFVGLGMGMHLSSLFNDLRFEQSDIEKNGKTFSIVIILFFNIIFLGIVLVFLNSDYQKILEFMEDILLNSKEILRFTREKIY